MTFTAQACKSMLPVFVLAFLAGCATGPTASPMPERGLALQGIVHGGQQPVVGAHVYLFAANTTGYGGSGIAASTLNASVSLLKSATNTTLDSSGGPTAGDYYMTTASDGGFSITSDYTCTSGQQLYVYALGGNPGAGPNSAAGLLAALGDCASLSSSTYIWINEISTIAAAYSFAGFATDATHVSSSGTTLAQTGIANAFANAANLVVPSTGTARTKTSSGTGTVPQTTINTLANMLASCVNSTGPSSTPCATLFANASSAGATGIVPTETATAAINIAHNPGATVANLYKITPPAVAFAPALTSQPNDLTLSIGFSGGALYQSQSLAIDGSGNVWVPTSGYILGYNSPTSYLVELSNSGVFLSPTDGFPGASFVAIDPAGAVWTQAVDAIQRLTTSGSTVTSTINLYTGGTGTLAVDGSGNAWFNTGTTNPFVVAEVSSTGSRITGPLGYADFVPGYEGGGIDYIDAAAIDGYGNAWFASVGNNSVNAFTPQGVAISPTSGFTPTGINNPHGLAIDSANNIWVVNSGTSSTVDKLSNSGSNLSGSGFAVPTPYAQSIALDGAGNVWVAGHLNSGNATSSVVELSNSGTILSGANTYLPGGLLPVALAVDGSGNLWTANNGGVTYSNVTETIGVAAPVVTPLSVAAKNNTLGTRP